MSYPEIAYTVTKKYLDGFIPDDKLKSITEEAYNFDVPIEEAEPGKYVMRLDRGPTAAFKDFAARMMARMVEYFLEEENKNLLVLVATSGDTGGAVASAYYGMDNVKMVILFPKKEVSERQRKQMTTLGKNIQAIAVEGKFDDCQAMVRNAFVDKELQKLHLSSANSINFGRLLPQIVYYFYAHSRVAKDATEKVIFSVPSGNFGNLLGGLIAMRMGLPVKKFIVAVNENDEFPVFLYSENYEPVAPSRNCISSAMNVGHPTSLARLVELYNGQIDEKGIIHKMPDMELMRKDLFSVSITDAKTRETIKEVYAKNGLILEPHGAVGWAGIMEYSKKNEDSTPVICLETADPAKFPEELEKLGISPKLPESMKKVDSLEEVDKTAINADYEEFRKLLLAEYS